MKSLGIVLLTLLMFISCEKKEAYLLPENKMVNIITDLHLAEAAAVNVAPSAKDSLIAVYETQIFKKHQIEKALFVKCLKQYQKEPVELEKIYKKAIEKLDKKES